MGLPGLNTGKNECKDVNNVNFNIGGARQQPQRQHLQLGLSTGAPSALFQSSGASHAVALRVEEVRVPDDGPGRVRGVHDDRADNLLAHNQMTTASTSMGL